MNNQRRSKLRKLLTTLNRVAIDLDLIFIEEDLARQCLKKPLKNSPSDEIEDALLSLKDIINDLKKVIE